jgi:hypothetical protein
MDLSIDGLMDPRISGSRDSIGLMDSLDSMDSIDPWIYGWMDLWKDGFIDLWIYGSKDSMDG